MAVTTIYQEGGYMKTQKYYLLVSDPACGEKEFGPYKSFAAALVVAGRIQRKGYSDKIDRWFKIEKKRAQS